MDESSDKIFSLVANTVYHGLPMPEQKKEKIRSTFEELWIHYCR